MYVSRVPHLLEVCFLQPNLELISLGAPLHPDVMDPLGYIDTPRRFAFAETTKPMLLCSLSELEGLVLYMPV